MKDTKILLTRIGLEKLKKELQERLTSVRRKIADAIEDARRMGDLSENAAYKAALEDRTLNEKVIKDLEGMILRSEIIERPSNGEISFGSKVTVSVAGKEMVYEVVGAMEADPVGGRISNESPIGSALMGKKIGEDVSITLPTGERIFRIVKVE